MVWLIIVLDPKNDQHDENPKENVKITNLINSDIDKTNKSKKNNTKGIEIYNLPAISFCREYYLNYSVIKPFFIFLIYSYFTNAIAIFTKGYRKKNDDKLDECQGECDQGECRFKNNGNNCFISTL